MGDAAFVARPHLGAGVTKAALDAASLADAIQAAGNDVETALGFYDRQQRPFGCDMVALGRQEGAYLSAQLKPSGERTPCECDRDVDSVIDSHNARRDSVGRLVAARAVAASA